MPASQLAGRVAAGTPRKAAIAQVAEAHNVPKRDVYDAVVRAKE